MSTANPDTSLPSESVSQQEEITSFAEILSDFEQRHAEEKHGETVTGTVVSVGPENILINVGRKTEGVVPVQMWHETQPGDPVPGATVEVGVGPLNEEGYYQLSTLKVQRPKDWSGLQMAFSEKRNIAGTVIEQVKGGFRVDIGVRAFLPASRSGVREADEMPTLVGQEIQCRITKLDVEKEDVVVDRRAVLEDEQTARREQRLAEIKPGDVVQGRVRNVMDFGAFVDLGGVDGLLHVMDMSWSRVAKASDAVAVGDELTVKVLKVDANTGKISLGLKQLLDEPWTVAARTFNVGDRVSGTVSRLTDFGAFVELMPGIDGLIHLSELSWDKRVRKPADVFKPGDRVDAVVLQVNAVEKRISLGYKQLVGDPWQTVQDKYPVGTTIEGPITNIAQFGAWVDLGDGVEGMVHVSDITNEKRLDHARDKLAKGQLVKAVVLEIDRERRRIRLGMKQLEPTSVDHYISEHQPGDTVSGRLVEVHGDRARVELGEGVIATCRLEKSKETRVPTAEAKTADVSSLSAMLAAKWKQGGSQGETKESARAGQIRRFRISNLDASSRTIELELAS
ncbi:MAG: 30S ribosomal protein S1 [Acidobacteriaceae bacterium]|nr:30S ribosomal protein S1 [Acidobacteriaceae bacterium]